jgi:hypothetical protein
MKLEMLCVFVLQGKAPSKRDGHAMVTVDSGIIMFGGTSG